jgi:hypothetical protein
VILSTRNFDFVAWFSKPECSFGAVGEKEHGFSLGIGRGGQHGVVAVRVEAKPQANRNRFVIIMAGRCGERFWPVSREKMPKHLLALLGKRSFLQQAVDSVAPDQAQSN